MLNVEGLATPEATGALAGAEKGAAAGVEKGAAAGTEVACCTGTEEADAEAVGTMVSTIVDPPSVRTEVR